MKCVKKTLKYSLIGVLTLIALVIIYLGAAVLLPRITVDKEPGTFTEVSAYIITNGTHTDIVVPAKSTLKDWTQTIRYENALHVDSSYAWLGMGWGDKGFYLEIPTWDDLTARIAFRAAFGLGSTAIHATYLKDITEGPECVKLTMSKEQYLRLVKYIESSFKTDEQGMVIKIDTDAMYGNTDAFYEAKGRYNIFHTCNTWTNNAIKSCGQRTCWWTAFDDGLFYQYR